MTELFFRRYLVPKFYSKHNLSNLNSRHSKEVHLESYTLVNPSIIRKLQVLEVQNSKIQIIWEIEGYGFVKFFPLKNQYAEFNAHWNHEAGEARHDLHRYYVNIYEFNGNTFEKKKELYSTLKHFGRHAYKDILDDVFNSDIVKQTKNLESTSRNIQETLSNENDKFSESSLTSLILDTIINEVSGDIIIKGYFIDIRDNQKYKIALLEDGNLWMTENLNYITSNSYCYDEDYSNCRRYGRLYFWKDALTACPSGWHIPTDDEWREMTKHYGMSYNDDERQQENKGSRAGEVAYKALLEGGRSGFDALLGGHATNGGFIGLGDFGRYWSSSERSSGVGWDNSAYYHHFDNTKKSLNRDYYRKARGFSCRCIQD